ncbi:hypothetical protein EYW49_20215 [Siculibacillus lacustris]|uniref:Flagellar protein FlaG n=1 Tax=Siculibacillus lacustris TaxID=1549641 RepID=A0A4V2KSN2_9HYPH|nr:hypothetical protein [Siculibacillus lacustris]TBW33503.1 hypothetical protein EYW49_20215 [Siculibacillus lacustris]
MAVRPSADPAPTAQPARVDSPQPVPQRHQEFEVDKSGLTVVMTFDESNGALVSQYPTEAYLRLANAMQNLVKSDVPAIDPNAGRTA